MSIVLASLALGFQLGGISPAPCSSSSRAVSYACSKAFDTLVESNVPKAVALLNEKRDIELSAVQCAALLDAACAASSAEMLPTPPDAATAAPGRTDAVDDYQRVQQEKLKAV